MDKATRLLVIAALGLLAFGVGLVGVPAGAGGRTVMAAAAR